MSSSGLAILRRISAVRSIVGRRVAGRLAGSWHSAFRGSGMEFHDVRPFQDGDDVRAIDWNVTARTGRPHIKRFCEERQQEILLLVDGSGSMRKVWEAVVEVAALIALSATENKDRVALTLFNSDVLHHLPLSLGAKHMVRLICDLAEHTPQGETCIDSACTFVGRVYPKRGLCFILSDFLTPFGASAFSRVCHHHEVIGLSFAPLQEPRLPDVGLIEITDPESGASRIVDSSSSVWKKLMEKRIEEHTQDIDRAFAEAGADLLHLTRKRRPWLLLDHYMRRRRR